MRNDQLLHQINDHHECLLQAKILLKTSNRCWNQTSIQFSQIQRVMMSWCIEKRLELEFGTLRRLRKKKSNSKREENLMKSTLTKNKFTALNASRKIIITSIAKRCSNKEEMNGFLTLFQKKMTRRLLALWDDLDKLINKIFWVWGLSEHFSCSLFFSV